MDVGSLQTQLGLDPKKKTAIIFPHIFWDGSLTEGSDLYPNYEEWFIESIRAACANPRVNWVIKIHPAHVFKSSTGYYQEEPLEVCVLHKNIGKLPSHVFLIPAESGISTFSLFDLMDYCLTVRGTIGIEAARLGIPVLTAGTGRYDRRGFTIDSDSREEYVDRLAHIQEIPRLSTAQRELGERFAYGLFILRPFPLVTVRFEYHKDYGAENGFEKTQINITSPEEWYSAPDLSAFAKWVTDSNNPDFLMPLPDE
jgi:capsule polysaccharide export protein KpsC/LpsZ